MKYSRDTLIEWLEKVMLDDDEAIKNRIKAAKSLNRHIGKREYLEEKIVPVFEKIMENKEAYSVDAANFLITLAREKEETSLI